MDDRPSRKESCNVLSPATTNKTKAAFRKHGKEVDTTKDMDSIYREYSGAVTAYLMRLCGDEDLAHELTQETFYQAIRSIHRFDGKSSVCTWLCSIARHLYYDLLRKRKPEEPLPENLPSTDDFTEQISRRDQAMIAHRMLHLLAEPYREVFTLRTFCDLNHAKIAKLFGKSASWSRVTYYRARQMLRDAMEENNDEEK